MNAIGGHELPNKGKTDIWLTPLEIILALGPFDLDPCAQPGHLTAKNMYSSDGLQRKWAGRVWLNPPYSCVGEWLEKLAIHGSGVALVFARTETKWAQKALGVARSVFFPAGRIRFLDQEFKTHGNAGAPSMFLSFGETPKWRVLGSGVAMSVLGS